MKKKGRKRERRLAIGDWAKENGAVAWRGDKDKTFIS
jgi:hypothetical protein